MNVRDIHTINWQMSLARPDSVVTGMDDVRQCVDIILKTRKGEDPLRPHFGCGLFDYMDKSANTAIPNMKKEILDALRSYEPRITVNSIAHEIVKGGVKFGINYKLPDGDSDIFEITATDQGVTTGTEVSQLILQAIYDPGAFRYNIALALDGAGVLPQPPSAGFASISDLFAWVTNYWYLFGAWHLLTAQNKIVLYVPGDVATAGNMAVQSITNVLSAAIPELDNPEEQRYQILFLDADSNRVLPYNADDIFTPGAMLAFVQANYSSYGTWSIAAGQLILDGSVDLSGYSLTIDVTEPVFTSAFTEGFTTGFEA